MPRKHKPPRSRLREKPARAPRLQVGRFEKSIAKYLEEVKRLKGETARSQRFTLLLHDLFGELEFPFIHDYLSGLESTISAPEGKKCRILRGQPDALYGNLIVEFERSLPQMLKEARRQLARYMTILRMNPETSQTCFIPIATDGVSFRVLAPKEGAALSAGEIGEGMEIEQIEEFDLNERQPMEFYFWLDRYFVRREEREPKAENFLQDFGTDSPAFREAGGLWFEVVNSIREHTDFKVIYENWRKYLRIAYGTGVGDEQLFIRHTFLATLAKLIAYIRITNARALPKEAETIEIIQGAFFEKQGVLNFLEEDFFSWVARDGVAVVTQRIVSRLVNLLFTYNLRELSEDVLKELYQKLVDPKDRHDLGEYYTPDWLAALMCEKLLDQAGEQTVLDPACGSGTFLYHLIRHKRKRLPATRRALEKILGSVVGIDIHPLAVNIAKVNVLLALGDLILKRGRAPFSVQIYLANSIRHPEKQRALGNGGLPAERVDLNKRVVLIPDAALASPARLDAAIRIAQEFAKAHAQDPGPSLQAFENYLRRQVPELAEPVGVVEMLFALAELLAEFIRKPEDTIWAYVLKNQYKPTFLKGQFDVVIGNPPWLSFRYVEKGQYQDYLKHLIVQESGLLEGAGHLISHLELGTLFFVRCATLYLKSTGKIGFVLPRSIFTADQHDRFRRSLLRGNTRLTEVWDLEQTRPLFNVPAAVAFGDLKSPIKEVLPGRILSGELRRKNASLTEARKDLTFQSTEFHVVRQGMRSFLSTSLKKVSGRRSFYQPHFKEGATIVPRNFWFVEFKGDPKLGIDPKQPLIATDPRAEAEAKTPYKGTHFEGPIEAEFLYATLLSTDLLPFGHFDFRPVVLPIVEDPHGYQLLDPGKARAKGFLGLADWIERAQETWVRRRKEKAKRADLLSWLNYRNKLTSQDPKAKYVVLYPKSATFLCAAPVRLKATTHRVGTQQILMRRFIADHVTYFFETAMEKEAHYLAAVLNSLTVDDLIKPMQARGLWGPRDIHKKVWELPIPEFRPDHATHARLAEIAEDCEAKVEEIIPNLQQAGSIGRARAAVRESLRNELAEIDSLVRDLLK